MTSVTRRLLRWPIGLAVLVGLFLIEERVRGSLAMSAYERALRAQGEKFTIAELAPPLPTNQSTRIVSAFEAQTLLGGAGTGRDFPAPMLAVAPGKARVAWSTPAWHDADSTNSWANLAPTMNSIREHLPELRRTLTNRSIFINLDYSTGFELLLPHLARAKGAMQEFNADTLYALQERRRDEAFENLVAATYLLDLLRDEGLVISQLVRIADGAIALGAVWEALQAEGWSDAELAALQRRWEEQQFLAAMVHALQLERAMSDTYFDSRRYTVPQLLEMLSQMQSAPWAFGGGPNRAEGFLDGLLGPLLELGDKYRRALHVVLWRFAWARQEQRFYHQTVQAAVDEGRRTVAERHWRTRARAQGESDADEGPIHGGLRDRTAYDAMRYLLSPTLVPGVDRSFDKAVRMDVAREVIVCAIALKRYQLRHGAWPDTLDRLVPEFLRDLPRDWYDGQPLRYRPSANGTFLLYSIGSDGRDDGGDSRDAKDVARGPLAPGVRDFVWPQPATPEEVVAAEAKGRTGR